LLNNIVADLKQWHAGFHRAYYTQLRGSEIDALTPSHILQFIDGFLTKYKGSKNKYVLTALIPKGFSAHENLYVGDLSINDLSRYEKYDLRLAFSKLYTSKAFYVDADRTLKRSVLTNDIYFSINEYPPTVVYSSYPIAHPIEINETVERVAGETLAATTFLLGFLALTIKIYGRIKNRKLMAVVPTKCGATVKKETLIPYYFGVLRVPQCDEDETYILISMNPPRTAIQLMLWENSERDLF
jgi:hypothetical protein